MQLQSYNGEPKTLCEIVGPKVIGNSTEKMSVLIYSIYFTDYEIVFHYYLFIKNNEYILLFNEINLIFIFSAGVILTTRISCHFNSCLWLEYVS